MDAFPRLHVQIPGEASRSPRSWARAILKLMLCVRQTYSIEKSSVQDRDGQEISTGLSSARLRLSAGPAASAELLGVESTVNLLQGTQEAGLTRQVQILSRFTRSLPRLLKYPAIPPKQDQARDTFSPTPTPPPPASLSLEGKGTR